MTGGGATGGDTSAQLDFECMGTTISLFAAGGAPGEAGAALKRAYSELHDFDRRLSRFRSDSELCALNSDPRTVVPVSPLMIDLFDAALEAARLTDGLIDPTIVGALEAAGYDHSLVGERPLRLRDGIEVAPPRSAGAPGLTSRWREIKVDRRRGSIRRPIGVSVDSGGVGKGLAADLIASRLAHFDRFVVNCGGDIRVGTVAPGDEPYEIEVEHPLTHEHTHAIRVRGGAVATSGVANRIWQSPDGDYAHHMIDPESGRPAWTGVIAATALGPTARIAESHAKAALLSGPSGAREWLERYGGLFVHDDGNVELVGVLAGHAKPRIEFCVGAR